MTKSQRNLLVLLAVVMIVVLVGIAGAIDYNQRQQGLHDQFAAQLTAQQNVIDVTMTAIVTH